MVAVLGPFKPGLVFTSIAGEEDFQSRCIMPCNAGEKKLQDVLYLALPPFSPADQEVQSISPPS